MIPKVNARGHSFKGIASYLQTAQDGQEIGMERVLWHGTGNMLTEDLDKAAKVMAWTARHAEELKREFGAASQGAKAHAGPVYHYSLAWAPGEEPDEARMRGAAHETLDRLGLAEHEFIMVAHGDRAHAHVHVVVNLVHPESGKRAEMGGDYRRLQDWALDYEQAHGLRCDARLKNAHARAQGRGGKHQDQKQDYATAVTRAFTLSDNGKSFVHALEAEGLHLAKARRGQGFVIVDEAGQIQKLGRQLEIEAKGKAKTAAINTRLADLDRAAIPDGEALAKEMRERLRGADREQSEADTHNRELDGADEAGRQTVLDDRKAAFREEKQKERREAAFAKQIAAVEQRHAAATNDLERRLVETVGPVLTEVRAQVKTLQGHVDGRGLRASARRLWQGRADRENLSHLKQRGRTIIDGVKNARAELARTQQEEIAALRLAHEQGGVRFKDLELSRKLEILDEGARGRPRGDKAGSAGDASSPRMRGHAEQRRNDQIAYRSKETERRKEQERATSRQTLAERVVAADRGLQLERQRESQEAKRAASKPGLIRAVTGVGLGSVRGEETKSPQARMRGEHGPQQPKRDRPDPEAGPKARVYQDEIDRAKAAKDRAQAENWQRTHFINKNGVEVAGTPEAHAEAARRQVAAAEKDAHAAREGWKAERRKRIAKEAETVKKATRRDRGLDFDR